MNGPKCIGGIWIMSDPRAIENYRRAIAASYLVFGQQALDNRNVLPGLDWYPFIGTFGKLGTAWIEDDQSGAIGLSLANVQGRDGVRQARVGADDDDQPGISDATDWGTALGTQQFAQLGEAGNTR